MWFYWFLLHKNRREWKFSYFVSYNTLCFIDVQSTILRFFSFSVIHHYSQATASFLLNVTTRASSVFPITPPSLQFLMRRYKTSSLSNWSFSISLHLFFNLIFCWFFGVFKVFNWSSSVFNLLPNLHRHSWSDMALPSLSLYFIPFVVCKCT